MNVKIEYSGFVALIGAPNAGKSTLVNQLSGQTVSIVSRKVQTTRSRFRAIVPYQDCQFILVDTPGLFAPRDTLDKAMQRAAIAGADEADFIWLIIDASRKNALNDAQEMLKRLKSHGLLNKNMAILLNKTDQMLKNKLLPLIAELQIILQAHGKDITHEDAKIRTHIFMISALNGDGCDELLAHAKDFIPQGPALYPQEQLTDCSLNLMAAEITRGHVFERMHQEIPYGVAVETQSWQLQKDGSVRIEQMIYVSREGFKKMLIGQNGQTVKAISMAARQEIALLTGQTIHLMVRVKHQENWRELKEFRTMQGLE